MNWWTGRSSRTAEVFTAADYVIEVQARLLAMLNDTQMQQRDSNLVSLIEIMHLQVLSTLQVKPR
jgi:hypothetical protein